MPPLNKSNKRTIIITATKVMTIITKSIDSTKSYRDTDNDKRKKRKRKKKKKGNKSSETNRILINRTSSL